MNLSRQLAASSILLGLLTAIPAHGWQSAEAARAPIPQLVSFSDALRDFDGRPARGVVGITFLLYKDEQDGSPLWRETQNVTLDEEGRFSVKLGSSTPEGLPAELFAANEARWLAIEPQGLPAPARVMLLSVPYALKAGDAETIGGLPPSAFARATASPQSNIGDPQPNSAFAQPATTSGSGTVNYIPRWTPNGSTLGNSILFQSGTGSAGKVGINTSTPAATLDVNGIVIARGALQLPARGAAASAAGFDSQPMSLQASVFSSTTHAAISPKFLWQAEPFENDTANATGTLNLLFGRVGTPVETGLSIAGNGQIKFAAGQTFPGTGSGTIAKVTAGSGLTGGGATGNVTLGIDATKVPLLAAANTFTAPITFVAGQTFPGTGTLTGITAGTGLTGGGATGNPTLGIDATKVPLLNAANTFTAPISFAAGQIFPGTGTITGVTAGTGLSGGGTSGSVTLNLNTTYSDGHYAQIAANNTFTGVQTINNAVGIGLSPSFPLHVMGTIRSETGLSLGGNAPVMVDAPGIFGGRLVVLANGKVGINQTNPSSTLDVGGSINASGALIGGSLNVPGGGVINGGLTTSAGITTGAGVSVGGALKVGGSLTIQNDTPMNAAPHMYFTGYVPGPLAANTYTLPIFTIASKDILITRVVAFGLNTCPSSGALTLEIDELAPGAQVLATQFSMNLATAYPVVADSGAIGVGVTAGTQLYVYILAPDCGAFGTPPSQITVSLEYVMQ